ncbi:MAG: sulfur carrier protein ThiS [Prevotella sp.]|nr:sulfur carrier protein ThiS [Bacteroides sp.]MCM1365892.1 sulfur carrier protein ThiS [Prevotella sp.]
MYISVNNEQVLLKEDRFTIKDLLTLRKIGEAGTAVAVNGKICKATNWDTTYLKDGDDVMLITAAYGG